MGINFAGNIAPVEAWEILRSDVKSRLVDVRTVTELRFVGRTDLSSIGKDCVSIPLVDEFGGQNPNFIQELESLGHPKDSPLIFICHGGGRSMQAAMVAGQMGYKTYNLEHGFCGDADEKLHRATINGWIASGLPWRQA